MTYINDGSTAIGANVSVATFSSNHFVTNSGLTEAIGQLDAALYVVTSSYVSSITAGTGISASSPTGAVTISNTGVVALIGGTAISVSGPTGSVTVNNTGVTSLAAGTAISVSASTGGITVANTGVTSLAAGTGISVSASTGGITITNTAPFSGGPFLPQTGTSTLSPSHMTGDIDMGGNNITNINIIVH